MIDLTKQKTFIHSSDYPINVFCDRNTDENFIIEQFESGSCKFSFYNEIYDSTEFICMVYSLEQLEKEYNLRSNHLFEWK